MIIQCKSVALRSPTVLDISIVGMSQGDTSPVLRDPVVSKNHIEVRGRHSYFYKSRAGRENLW